MSSTATTGSAVTGQRPAATAPQTTEPLTTPFTAPSGCSNQFGSIFTVKKSCTGAGNVLVQIVLSAPDRYSSCQPARWNASRSTLSFSPAVCPISWTAYNLMVMKSLPDSGASKFQSLAHCCTRFVNTIFYFAHRCASKLTNQVEYYFVSKKSALLCPR